MYKGLLVTLLIIGLCFPIPANANGLPQFAVQQNPNGTISPLNKVPVAINKEVLTIELSGKNPAQIKANYTLKNLSSNKIYSTVLFPVDTGQSASVVYNGHQIETKRSPFRQDLTSKDFEVSKTWIDPYNNHQYVPRSPKGSSNALYTPHRLELIIFQVELESNQKGNLVVTYRQPPSYDATWLFRDINYRFDYLLQPARHWASFRNLEVNVLTSGNMALASSIKLLKVGPNHYQARFDKLPKENLSLFIGLKPNKYSASRVWNLLNGPFGYKALVFMLVLFGFICIRRFKGF